MVESITRFTYSQREVPASSREGSSIGRNLQARNFVFVAIQQANSLTAQSIPNVDGVVIIPGKQQATRNREVNRVHAEDYAFLAVDCDFFVGAEIKQAAR